MAVDSMTVRHYVGEDGSVYLELSGLKAWVKRRHQIREVLRQENANQDPGPLLAMDILTALEKVPDGRS